MLSDTQMLLLLLHFPLSSMLLATLSACVVLGLIPLQLAPVLAWTYLGQVVPNPKKDERLFFAIRAIDKAGFATRGEP